MNKIIQERAQRLSSVVPGAEGFPLLRWIPIELDVISSLMDEFLRHCVDKYEATSWKNLSIRRGNGRLDTSGVKEALEPLTAALVDIARRLPGIDAVEKEPNVRIYDGAKDSAIQNFHVDMWTGEPADTIVMIIPFSGDVETCGVRFTEPVNPDPAKYTAFYGEYGAGLEANPEYIEYPVKMQLGNAYLMDSYCLHQSMKGVGLRTSIDYRLRYRDKLPSDQQGRSTHKKYVLL